MSLPTAPARRLVELACHAPSVHNTQPWLWRVDGDQVLLYADRRRQLPVEDPDGRNLTISCGAALHHLQFAAHALGWASDVTLMPRPDQPDLLATVRLERGEPSTQPVDDLAAIRRRCTDRRRFTSWPVPPDVLDKLAEEARELDVQATPVVDLVARFRLELLMSDANALRELDRDAVREQASWIDRAGAEGVPLAVLPRDEHAEELDRPSRFGAGLVPENRAAVDSGDGLIVLGGATDDPTGWLRTGQGLSALWLRATHDGLSVVPLSLPVEVESIRLQLTETVLGRAIIPHLAVRIGWQAIGRTGLPRTPRRTLDDVLLR
jgi:hypothetical protein